MAKDEFDVFITVDQNLEYQQNLEGSGMAVVLIPKVQQALQTIQAGQLVRVESGD